MRSIDVPEQAIDVAWEIDSLLPSPGRAGVEQLLDEADGRAVQLETAKGSLSIMEPHEVIEVVAEIGAISELLGRAGNYASLAFSVDTASPEIGALMQLVQERATRTATRLVFFELEWGALDQERVDGVLATTESEPYRHHLETLRQYRPYQRSEAEEQVLMLKDTTGSNAWSRLFDELTAAITIGEDQQSLDVALAGLHDADAQRRARAAERISDGLQPTLRTRTYVFNTLLADKSVDDELRGYATWISSRNLHNEASDASVDALVEAVVARYDIAQRWYATKAEIMGVDQLDDWDRYASLAHDESSITWAEGARIVYESYHSFSPRIAEVVASFLQSPWIDAPVRPGKRGGAFCAYTVPSHHPYLMLNWTGRRRDVLTLAHELGHGVHAFLAREQGVFHQSTPLTLAETASVFGETITINRMLGTIPENEQLPILASHLEDQIATVFRQVAMHRFEEAVHAERRNIGELSVDRFGDLWIATQAEMLGSSVRLSDGYRDWWSYIPHFVHTPGYVYAYAYGQLLALSVYAEYERQGPDFVEKYEQMLAAGGSRAPEALAGIVGIDLTDPEFWASGLEIVDRLLRRTQEAAGLTTG